METDDAQKDSDLFETVLQDWMRLFPQEYEAFLNHEKLVALNPYYEGHIDINVKEGTPRFTYMRVTRLNKPVMEDYESGNPDLDKERFELALEHWYFRYQPDLYVKLYEVEDYLIDTEGKPGTDPRLSVED